MELPGRSFSCRRRSILRSESHLSQSLQRFMASPLVTWVRTLATSLDVSGGDELQYLELRTPGRRDWQSDYLKLVDGVFLNRVMRQIDPNPQTQRIYRNENNDEVLRVQNLSILVQHIRSFYQEDLQQLVLMTPPNVQLLGRDPLSDEGLQELAKVLLLLLGCAVQSERKEEVIEQIRTLDLDTQAAVAEHILEVTQSQQNVVSLNWPDLALLPVRELELLFHNMACHLRSLAKQRDDNLEKLAELSQERERSPGEGRPPGMGESHQNLTVQLADARAKLRRLRQEMEEKNEHLQDCKQELQELQTELKSLQKQNRELVMDARTAQTYRDEVDVLREKATRVDRLQSEVKAYKERLNSIEFYRGKAEEERAYSQALLETKALLEEQLEAAHARCDKLHEVEMANLLLRSALQDLEMERENERQRIDELLDINLSLKAELNERPDEAEEATWRAGPLSEELPHGECIVKPLSCEVGEATTGQLLRLERENQELRRQHEQLRQSCAAADVSTNARIVSLEQEKQQLQTELERLRSQMDAEKERSRNLGVRNTELLTEKSRLEESLRTVRGSCDREVQGLKQENARLRQSAALLRQSPHSGSHSGSEDGPQPVERENEPQQEALAQGSLELEGKRVQQELEQYRAKAHLAEELSQELERCRAKAHLAEELSQELEQCRAKAHLAEELSQELEQCRAKAHLAEELSQELEQCRAKAHLAEELSQELECCRAKAHLAEELSQELERCRAKAHLAEELSQDQEGKMEAGRERLPSLEEKEAQREEEEEEEARRALQAEREELARERQHLRRRAESLQASLARSQELEATCRALRAEAQRQARTLQRAEDRVSELEEEAEALEAEAQRTQREVVEVRAEAGRLERDKEALGEALRQAEKERGQLEKEGRRLRQQAGLREASLDEQNARLLRLEQENRRLALEAARVGELLDGLAEMEAESAGLARRLAAEQGELAVAREELLKEKLRNQQLSSQLDNLSHKVQRLRPDQEQGVHSNPTHQPSNYELLERQLDSVLGESVRTREASVERLRAQLESAQVENAALSRQLRELKENVERPHPRRGDGEGGSAAEVTEDAPGVRRESLPDPISDRLIEVERNNATLLAERGSLSCRAQQLESQVEGLQAQVVTLQQHCISLQEQVSGLQALNTRLQVENTSLSSRNEALVAEGSQQRARQASLEAEAKALGREQEDVRGQLEALSRDHARLAVLHERQEAELEALVKKNGALKASYKTLETEHKELEGRYNQLRAEKGRLEELEASVRSRQEALEAESQRQQSLSQAHQQLKDDFDRLTLTHEVGVRQWEELQLEHTAVKSQLNALQLEKTRTDVELGILREQFQQLDMRWAKLSSHCELLSQLKGNVEEENRQLTQQVRALADDNRTLLERTVESRDQFHEEQRQYADKLNKLRREKQKLVEKIMDQYRVVDPALPRSRKGNWIADKMKKLIKPRKDLSKDQLRPYFINPTGNPDMPEGIVHLSQMENSGPLPEADRPGGVPDTPGPQTKGLAGEGAPEQQEKVLVWTRRKLSSRIYGSDTPRHRFRQRRVGWDEEEAETSRDSDPTLDGKEMAKGQASEDPSEVTEIPGGHRGSTGDVSHSGSKA